MKLAGLFELHDGRVERMLLKELEERGFWEIEFISLSAVLDNFEINGFPLIHAVS